MTKALVVDDEEEICDFLAAVLEEMNCEVQVAISGEEALRKVESWEPSIAVVDLRLSTRATGLDVIRTLREKFPKAAVLAMTGYVDVALRQQAESLGVQSFLEKPDDLKPDRFKKKVEAFL